MELLPLVMADLFRETTKIIGQPLDIHDHL
jgi:hypothetical protein